MRCLDEFLRDEFVQSVIAGCRESRAVQGVLVELHPLWMWAWRIGESYNPMHPDKGFEEAVNGQWDLVDIFPPYTFERRMGPWLPFRSITEQDLYWKPEIPWWGGRLRTYSKWPIVMRICLHPQWGRERADIPQYRAEGFRIAYEVRPVARFYAGPRDKHRPLLGGVSVGFNSTHAGTMGGILTDGKSGFFGVTCAHVVGSTGTDVEQPASLDRKGTVIGKVVQRQLPRTFPPQARKVPAAQGMYAAKVDVALIEIDGPNSKLEVLKMGKVRGVISIDDIAQNEELELTGRTSDWQKVQKSSRVPFYNLINDTTGDEYCFENPLIFREPSGASAAQPGDSGAWLCKEVGTDYQWAAMVVGGDKQLGVAVASEELKTWWESAGYKLATC
jgi:hypothetical protein